MKRSNVVKVWMVALAAAVLLPSVAQALLVVDYADASCRVEGASYADTNRHDSSKLSVRAASNGVKGYIKFDITNLDVEAMSEAYLRVTLHAAKTGSQHFDVSAVNDDCLDNIGWLERGITWNNAPGNDTASLGLLDAAKTTLLETVDFTDGLAGQQFLIDILPVLQADTDGIVQFVLHNSPNLLDFAQWDHPLGQEYYPAIVVPEPATMILLGIGGLIALKRHNR